MKVIDLQRSEKSFDRGGDRIRWCVRSVTLENSPVAIDQKLGEIPFDGAGAEDAGGLLGEILEQRVCVGTVDVDLFEQRKRDAVVARAKLADFFV